MPSVAYRFCYPAVTCCARKAECMLTRLKVPAIPVALMGRCALPVRHESHIAALRLMDFEVKVHMCIRQCCCLGTVALISNSI